MKRTKPWELSDEVWERVHPLIPERPAHPKGGQPAQRDWQMLSAILYVLRTGIQWNALPRELGAFSPFSERWRSALGFCERRPALLESEGSGQGRSYPGCNRCR